MTRYLVRFPVACSCGRLYTKVQWRALPFVGLQVDSEETLELRNCTACNSTQSVPVEREARPAKVEEIDTPRGGQENEL